MRRPAFLALLAAGAVAISGGVRGQTLLTVQPAAIADEKPVFATVESRNVVPARARIGGTLTQLAVHDGEEVKAGQVLARVGDEKLLLQLHALDAQIAGLQSQLTETQTDLGRMEILAKTGAVSKTQLDQSRTAADVAASALHARIAERGVTAQQMNEGDVLAPTDGRVLRVPLTQGSVVMPGDPVADIAQADYILRLRVPERQAAFLRAGDTVRVDGRDLGGSGPEFGTLTLVYPQIEDGRVLADATAHGVGSYFVGQRVRVWITVGRRQSFRIPEAYVVTLDGLTYVRRVPDGAGAGPGAVVDSPVQLGQDVPTPAMPDGVEVLSGLHAGDVLVHP